MRVSYHCHYCLSPCNHFSLCSPLKRKLPPSTLGGVAPARQWKQITIVQQLCFLGYSALSNSTHGRTSIIWPPLSETMASPITLYSLCSKGKILPPVLPAVFSFPALDILHEINWKGQATLGKAVLTKFTQAGNSIFSTLTLNPRPKEVTVSETALMQTHSRWPMTKRYWPFPSNHLSHVKGQAPQFPPKDMKSTFYLFEDWKKAGFLGGGRWESLQKIPRES